MLRLLTDLNENARFDAVASTSLLTQGPALSLRPQLTNRDIMGALY
jgi:hypothetical protein